MEYQSPFKSAFKIAGKFKSLWIAGLFTAGIHLGNHLFQLYDKLGIFGFPDLIEFRPTITKVYWLFALITLIILLFGSIFQAGLIKIICNLKTGSGLYVRQIWRYGTDNWGKTLLFIFIKLLAVFAIFHIISILSMPLFFENQIIRAGGYFILNFTRLLFFVILIIVFYASTFGLRIMLTENKSVFGSFRSGLIFLLNNYKKSIVSGLFFLLFLIAAFIISLFITGIVLAIVFLLSFLLSSINIKAGFAAFLILFISLFLPVAFIIFGFIGLLRDAFWTFTYIKLNEQQVFIFNNR